MAEDRTGTGAGGTDDESVGSAATESPGGDGPSAESAATEVDAAFDETTAAAGSDGGGAPRSGSTGSDAGGSWPARELLPRDAGRYRFEELVGRGGLGRVMRAHDLHLDRPVAVKELLRRGGVTEKRFRHEALITAGLQHHGVVPVHDAGRWSDGAPFYAMKLVSGRPLSELIDEADGVAGRLALLPKLIAVADTMAYAHSEGVIHRDLKPSNVMVGDFGETMVVDWGLAKRLGDAADTIPSSSGAGAADEPELTRAGDVMGTLLYMPPEQARGESVDARADVYAHGAMLYHTLAGVAPYRDRVAPGHRLTRHTILKGPPTPLSELAPDAPRELIAVVDKAMARDAADRYPTARELAEELQRFQAGQLVGAHRYSARELLARWARRHRTALVVAGVAALVLLAVGAVSIVRIVRAERAERAERKIAEQARSVAEDAQRTAELESNRLRINQAMAALDRDPTEALAWLKMDGEVTAEMRERIYMIATDAHARGVAEHVLPLPGPAVQLAAAPDSDVFAVATAEGAVRAWRTGLDAVVEHELGAPPVALAISDDGGSLLAATADGSVSWWHDRLRARDDLRIDGGVRLARLTPDGRRAVLLSPDGEVRVLERDRPTPALIQWRAVDVTPKEVEIAPTGRYLALAHGSGELTVVTLEAGERPRSWRAHDGPVVAVAFSPDGELFSLGRDGRLVRWNPSTGAELGTRQLGTEGIGPLRVWRRGGAAGVDGPRSLAIWREDGDARRVELDFPPDPDIAYLPDLDWLVAASGPDLWIDGGSYQQRLRGHVDRTMIARTGSAIVSASEDATARVWSIPSHPSRRVSVGFPWTAPVAVADRAWVVGGQDGWLTRVPVAGPSEQVIRLDGQVVSLVPGASGRWLGSAAITGQVLLVESGRVRFERRVEHPGSLRLSDASLAVVTGPGKVRAWRLEDGAEYLSATTVSEPLLLELLPDGWVLSEDGAGDLVVRSGDGSRRLGRLDEKASASAAGVEQTSWFVGTVGGSLVHVDGSGRVLGTARAHERLVWDVEVSSRGDVASAGGDGSVCVWTVNADGSVQLAHRFRGHDQWAHGVAFSPDGAHLVSWSAGEPRVRVWDVARGSSRVLRVPGRVRGAAFSGDGSHVAISDYDEGVFLYDDWRPAPPPHPASAAAWLRELTSASISGAAQLASSLGVPARNDRVGPRGPEPE